MEVSGKRLDEDIVSKLCEPCQEENMSTLADGYCNDCEEYMCQTCFRSHLKMKLGRNHVLGTLTADQDRSKQKQEDKCKKHTRETIKYYCRNHDRVVCGDCIVSDHMTCKPEFITELGKKFEESSEFKNLLGQIEKWGADLAESKPRIESYKKENHALLDNAIREIKKFRSEINTWLDTMEKNIKAEVRKISDENEMHLSELEKKIRTVSEEIVMIKEQLDSNVYQGDSLFIRRVECKPMEEAVAKSMSAFKSDKGIKTYSFEPETTVREMMTSSVKLGIIKITRLNEIKAENKPTSDAETSVKNVYHSPGISDTKTIAKWETDIAESKPRIESYRKENQDLFDNAIREIKTFPSENNIWFDTIEKNIEAEVRKISDDNEMHLPRDLLTASCMCTKTISLILHKHKQN